MPQWLLILKYIPIHQFRQKIELACSGATYFRVWIPNIDPYKDRRIFISVTGKY